MQGNLTPEMNSPCHFCHQQMGSRCPEMEGDMGSYLRVQEGEKEGAGCGTPANLQLGPARGVQILNQ